MSINKLVDNIKGVCDGLLKNDTRPFFVDNNNDGINDYQKEYQNCQNLDKDSYLDKILDRQDENEIPVLSDIEKYIENKNKVLNDAELDNDKAIVEIKKIKKILNKDNYNEIFNNYSLVSQNRDTEDNYTNNISVNSEKLKLNLKKENKIKFHANFHFFLFIMLLILFVLLFVVYFIKL